MITKDEYGQRVARLKAGIDASNLDAYIVSEPESIYYFTGGCGPCRQFATGEITGRDRDDPGGGPVCRPGHGPDDGGGHGVTERKRRSFLGDWKEHEQKVLIHNL
jgi:hypothetical protein